ncbi:MAG: MFS transporter [Candidatus Aminicenantes bacterium]|nr:MFS transporter [Candidatus Aminicenantes bacterium]
MKKNLVKISVSTFLLYGGVAVLVYFSLFLKDLGLNDAQIGLIVSLFSWTALFVRPVGGKIADSLTTKTLLLLGAGLFSFSLIGLGFAGKNIPAIIALRIASGLGFAWYALGSLLQSVEGEELKNFTGNVSTLSVFYLLPYFAYPFIAIKIARSAGFKWMFLFAGFLAFLSIPLILSIKNPKRKPSEKKKLRIKPGIIFLGVMNFLMGWCVNIAFPFVPLIEKIRPGIETGLFFTMVSAVAVAIRAYIGRKFSFWGRPAALIPGFLGYACGFFAAYFARNTLEFMAVGILIGIGVGIVYPNVTAMTLRCADQRYRGVTMGFVSSMGDLGFCTGPIIFGYLSFKLGLLNSFLLWAAIMATIPLIIVTSFGKTVKR